MGDLHSIRRLSTVGVRQKLHWMQTYIALARHTVAGGHLQTIFSALANFEHVDKVVYERQYLRVPDGGTLSLDFAPPFSVAPADSRPCIVVIHGLTGKRRILYEIYY